MRAGSISTRTQSCDLLVERQGLLSSRELRLGPAWELRPAILLDVQLDSPLILGQLSSIRITMPTQYVAEVQTDGQI